MKTRNISAEIERRTKIAERSFSEVFRSMQLLNYTVLYYNFDFDKEMVKKFNANITDYNNECLDDSEAFFAEEARILKDFAFSCERSAKEFPMRAKMKMCGKRPKGMKDWDIVLKNATEAIEICLLLFLHECVAEWNFTESDVMLYWQNMKENAKCYADGMTDEFVVQYFKDYLDLEITE